MYFLIFKLDAKMTHNEKRGHWVREGAISLGTGILYGVTVVGAAHVSGF